MKTLVLALLIPFSFISLFAQETIYNANFQSSSTELQATPFTLSSSGESVMPITLLWFIGYAQDDNTIMLEWESASEEYIDYYSVLKSTDLEAWEKVEDIASRHSTSTAPRYELVDKNPTEGTLYYLLVGYDNNGIKHILSSYAVNFEKKSKLTLYPNPTESNLFMSIINDEVSNESFSIYSSAGQLVSTGSIMQTATLDVSNLSVGLYFIVLNQDPTQKFTFYKTK